MENMVVPALIANAVAHIGLTVHDPLTPSALMGTFALRFAQDTTLLNRAHNKSDVISSHTTTTTSDCLSHDTEKDFKGIVYRHMGDICTVMDMLTDRKVFTFSYEQNDPFDIHPSKGIKLVGYMDRLGIANGLFCDLKRHSSIRIVPYRCEQSNNIAATNCDLSSVFPPDVQMATRINMVEETEKHDPRTITIRVAPPYFHQTSFARDATQHYNWSNTTWSHYKNTLRSNNNRMNDTTRRSCTLSPITIRLDGAAHSQQDKHDQLHHLRRCYDNTMYIPLPHYDYSSCHHNVVSWMMQRRHVMHLPFQLNQWLDTPLSLQLMTAPIEPCASSDTHIQHLVDLFRVAFVILSYYPPPLLLFNK